MGHISIGTELKFKVPDAFRHENEVRNFMLITSDDIKFSLMYCNNKCHCKDGWIKFPDFCDYPVTKEKIIEFLKTYYKEEFDETSLVIH